ncbi:MAG: helix-turn-helix transcriptional regulator [Chloroflexota bacterium]
MDEALDRVGLLAEPVRRAIYLHVAASPSPLSRDEVAAAVGIGRPLATFHLERLAAAGLLDTSTARRSGRTGPGAGRPAKLYRRGTVEVAVSVPDRRYETLAGVLAGAIEPGTRETATNAGDVLDTEGFELGRSLVDGALAGRPRPRSRAARRELALDALQSGGYAPGQGDALAPDAVAPAASSDTILLANCPYDAVARAHRDVVCRMNVSVVRGVADGAGLPEDGIALVPADGRCCVIWSEP